MFRSRVGRWLYILLIAGLLSLATAATVLPLAPPVAPPAVAWDVLVIIGGGLYLAYEYLDDFIVLAGGTIEYVGSLLQSRDVDPEAQELIDAGAIPEVVPIEEFPEPPASPVATAGVLAAVSGVMSALLPEQEGYVTVSEGGSIVYGPWPQLSELQVDTGGGPTELPDRVQTADLTIGSTVLEDMPVNWQDVLTLAVTGSADWMTSAPSMADWLALGAYQGYNPGWEEDDGYWSYYQVADSAPWNGLAAVWDVVRWDSGTAAREWMEAGWTDYGALYVLGAETLDAGWGLNRQLWGTWEATWSAEPPAPPWVNYSLTEGHWLFAHYTEMYTNVEGPAGDLSVEVHSFEIVRADSTVNVSGPGTSYDDFAGMVTAFQSVGHLAFGTIAGVAPAPDGSSAGYYWTGMVALPDAYAVGAWHGGLTHYARALVAGAVATYPDVSIVLGTDAVMPWDVEGAADFGTAVQQGTGLEVWWLVNPVAALQAAFVPTVPLSTRAQNMVDALSAKFPFALAAAISWGSAVGSGPLEVASIEFGGMEIEPDNPWLNSLGALTRLAATTLALTLLFVWIRGKVMPRTVI